MTTDLQSTFPCPQPTTASPSRLWLAVFGLVSLTWAVGAGCLSLEGRPCSSSADCIDGYQCAADLCQRVEDIECDTENDCNDGQRCEEQRCIGDAADGGNPAPEPNPEPAAEPNPTAEPDPEPNPEPGPTPEPGPGPEAEPDPPPDSGPPLFEITRTATLSSDANGVEVVNPIGAVTLVGDAIGTNIGYDATIYYPAAVLNRLDEIEIELDGGGFNADVVVSIPNQSAFDAVRVDLVVHVPASFSGCIFPGSAHAAIVEDLTGGVEVVNGGDVTLIAVEGELVVESEFGDVSVTTSLTDDVDVETASGNIAAFFPEDASFWLDASYQLGGRAELNGFNLVGANLGGTASGYVGGIGRAQDTRVTLTANSGAVSITAY